MSFWLREARWIANLRAYSRFTKMGLSLSLFSLFIAGWVYLFYFPAQSLQEHLILQLNILEQKKRALLLRVHDFDVIKSQKRSSDVLFQQAQALYGSVTNGPDLFTQAIYTHNLVCAQLEPMIRKQKDAFLYEQFHVNIHGSFADVLSFFQTMDTYKYLIKYGPVTCSRLKNHKITCDMVVRLIHLFQGSNCETITYNTITRNNNT